MLTSLLLCFGLSGPSVLAEDLDRVQNLLAEARIEEALALLEPLPESYRSKLLLSRAYRAWAYQMQEDGASSDDVQFTRLDAVSHLHRAIELAPAGESEAVIELGGLLLFELGRYDEALALATEHLPRHPEHPELLLLRGNALTYDWYYKSQASEEEEADAAWNQAVADLQTAAKHLPRERLEALRQLVYLYNAKGHGEEAVTAQIQIVERQDDPELLPLYELAKTYSYARQFGAAARALETIIKTDSGELRRRIRRERDPDDVALNLHWAASVFMNRNDNANAYAILSIIAATDPKAPDIWDNYAVACQGTGRLDEAIKAYDKKIELRPDDPRTYNDKAKILEEDLKRDPSEVIPLYEKAIAMAEEQLQLEDLDPTWKAHLDATLRIARGNLSGVRPSGGASRLGSALDRLRAAEEGGGGGNKDG